MNPHIANAAEVLGSSAALAEALGCRPEFVSQLKTGRRPVPAELCPVIERLTAGTVTCEDLRPDIEWAVVRRAA